MAFILFIDLKICFEYRKTILKFYNDFHVDLSIVSLVFGFTGKKVAKFRESYIDAFDAMEKKLVERMKTATLNH
jgi:phage regulator Rha-like protein